MPDAHTEADVDACAVTLGGCGRTDCRHFHTFWECGANRAAHGHDHCEHPIGGLTAGGFAYCVKIGHEFKDGTDA